MPRNRNGARVPAQLQRMYAEDLLQGVFPDAAACLDNIAGRARSRTIRSSIRRCSDCLEEAMDLPRLVPLLERISSGELRCLARETPEPSVFCHELLNSAVYTFLDDAPLEERRTQAVYTRRATEPRNADDLGALDPAAIAARARGSMARSHGSPTSCTMRCCWRGTCAATKCPRARGRGRGRAGLPSSRRPAGRSTRTATGLPWSASKS